MSTQHALHGKQISSRDEQGSVPLVSVEQMRMSFSRKRHTSRHLRRPDDPDISYCFQQKRHRRSQTWQCDLPITWNSNRTSNSLMWLTPARSDAGHFVTDSCSSAL